VPVQSGARTHYSPRGLDPLRRLFCQRFPALQASYEKRYAAFFGTFRLPLIARAASAFRLCGGLEPGHRPHPLVQGRSRSLTSDTIMT